MKMSPPTSSLDFGSSHRDQEQTDEHRIYRDSISFNSTIVLSSDVDCLNSTPPLYIRNRGLWIDADDRALWIIQHIQKMLASFPDNCAVYKQHVEWSQYRESLKQEILDEMALELPEEPPVPAGLE